MTPDTAPEAITQAEAWRVNPDTPSTIITPHGRISIGWTVASAGSASDYSLAEQTAAEIVEAMNHRRLNSHSAGEGLREAMDLALGYLIQNEPGDSRAVSDEFVAMAAVEAGVANAESLAIIARARAALLTRPSDAGFTMRSGGEGVLDRDGLLPCRACGGHAGFVGRGAVSCFRCPETRRSRAEWNDRPSPDASPDTRSGGEGARPMETAPKDGTMISLLVDYTDGGGPLEDEHPLAWTIGFNGFEDHGVDGWKFAGWCWTHDHFAQGSGTPVGWLPWSNPSTAGGEA